MFFHTWGVGVKLASKFFSCSGMRLLLTGPLRIRSTMSVTSASSVLCIVYFSYNIDIGKPPSTVVSFQCYGGSLSFTEIIGMRAYWLLLQGITVATAVTNPNYWKLYCGCPKAPSTPPAYDTTPHEVGGKCIRIYTNNKCRIQFSFPASNQPSPLYVGDTIRGETN